MAAQICHFERQKLKTETKILVEKSPYPNRLQVKTLARGAPLPESSSSTAYRLRLQSPVSLRLGHARVLTVHRTAIQYPRAASLPYLREG